MVMVRIKKTENINPGEWLWGNILGMIVRIGTKPIVWFGSPLSH